MKYSRKVLSDIAIITAGQSPDSKYYNKDKIGLPFYQGKTDFGSKYPNARSWFSGDKCKIAKSDDILLSVRAPVGPVNICKEESAIGRGIASIRAKKQSTYYEYLYYYLKAHEKDIERLGTGSTFKAISKTHISNIKIPLPPLEDQKRIASLLSRVEKLIARRKESIQLLDELLKSSFLEMFGNPVRNEKGWEKKPLSKLGNLDRGVSKHRPRNAPELLGGKYPLIQTGDVSNSGIYISKYSQTYSEIGYTQSKLWPTGTLCITIAANIAQTGILSFDACFPDSVVGFKPYTTECNELYILGLFWFFQKILEKNAPAAAQKNINLNILRNLLVPKPPIELQSEFASIVEKIESIKSRYQQSLIELENLYGSLCQKAFKGELDLSRIPLPKEDKPGDKEKKRIQIQAFQGKDEPEVKTETKALKTFATVALAAGGIYLAKKLFESITRKEEQIEDFILTESYLNEIIPKTILLKMFDDVEGRFSFIDLWGITRDSIISEMPENVSLSSGWEDVLYSHIKSELFNLIEEKQLSQIFDEEKKEMLLSVNR